MSLQEEHENYLMHYGVKGMKWGVRKEYVPHPRKRKTRYGVGPSSTKKREDQDSKYDVKKAKRAQILGGIATAIGGLGAGAATAVGIATTGTFAPALALSAPVMLIAGIATVASAIHARNKAKKAVEASDAARAEAKIDKKTGLRKKKSKEFTEADVKAVNPFFDAGDASSTHNCACCTAALEMRKRGYEVRAKKTTVGYYDDEIKNLYKGAKISKQVFASGDSIENASPFASFSHKQAVDITNSILKEGGRGHLLVTWSGGGGHSVYYTCDKDGLKIYDGQVGKIVANTTKEAQDYLSRNVSSERHINVANATINMAEMKKVVE